MNLLETLLSANNGGVIGELAKNVGLGEADARNAVQKMAPALSKGFARNAKQSGGLDALLGALAKGNHARYLDQPGALSDAGAAAEGNKILGHVLGSKDVSRNVAAHVASDTGLDVGSLKKLLPLVAAAAMGAMGKKTGGGGGGLGSLVAGLGGQSGAGGMLEQFLDADGDGSIADDVLSMAKKFF